jgi:hypothetical protein
VSDKTRTLYRPVGLEEARLILEAHARAFPPRLPHQLIFYPVLNVEYARQMARDWNTKDAASGYAGFVTEFDVDGHYLSQFKAQLVGASTHKELWIPAEQLAEFNERIDGQIRFVEAYYGSNFKGVKQRFSELQSDEMLKRLYMTYIAGEGIDYNGELAANPDTILLNLPYWRTLNLAPDILISEQEKQKFLARLTEFWLYKFRDLEAAAHGLLHRIDTNE